MGLERFGFEFGVELHPYEPRMVRALDDLREGAVRAHAGEDQAAPLERVLAMDVDLVAVAVAIGDAGGVVGGGDVAVAVQLAF